MIGAAEDDLKVLLGKRFILPFQSGVVVIKHWLIHNTIRKDRYKETRYVDEKRSLFIKENSAYTDLATNGKPIGNQMAPQVKLSKAKLSKVKEGAIAQVTKSFNPQGAEIVKAMEAVDPKNKTYYKNTTQRGACDFLLSEYGIEDVLKRISVLSKTNKIPHFPVITSPNDLKEKWVKLQDAVDRKRSEVATKTTKVAFS